MWQSLRWELAGSRDPLFLEHAEPLGSIGLNGACDDLPMSTSRLAMMTSECYNYYNRVPSNTDLTPAKPNTDTNSGTALNKAQGRIFSTYPTSYLDGERNPTLMLTYYTREMSSHTSPASSKRPKAVPNEASQQEESNATTLTSIGAIYRRQSKKIRSLYSKQILTNSNDVAQVHYHNWTCHPLLRSESLAQKEYETQNGVPLYTLKSQSKRCRSNNGDIQFKTLESQYNPTDKIQTNPVDATQSDPIDEIHVDTVNEIHADPKDVIQDAQARHYHNWTCHPLLRSESLAQKEYETQNGVPLYTLKSQSKRCRSKSELIYPTSSYQRWSWFNIKIHQQASKLKLDHTGPVHTTIYVISAQPVANFAEPETVYFNQLALRPAGNKTDSYQPEFPKL
ncbi:hypothetical protein F511_39361 [Dorcoceras hygrometricum]|uniref:Uncharacterized protein n=1 Tax=Dorcoceras hygrometricum TaxID=472368 RepID=A0A2Z7BA45_9LAMI|nr:hypothetical protein F511_39361 [Dorcoceras hygrometricum]